MGKPKVLLLGQLDHIADTVTTKARNRDQFLQECKNGKHDGVVAICDRAPSSFTITARFDQEIIEALPESLKFICHNGAGYDNFDVEACTKRGFLLSNCPLVVDNATADTAMFLILGFNNGILEIRGGRWKGSAPPPPLGHDLQGKTLGILGMGGIGQNLKKKAEAFGMKVIYHNRTNVRSDLAPGAEYVSFDDLLGRTDVLSLNLPLNSKTRNFISTKEFKKMKRDIVIVNTARGGVMDEDALVKAIDSGIVRSVGLDVYQHEPNIHPGLVSNPHVCLLPHMGTFTVETKTMMEELAISNVRMALKEGKLETIVPEQAHLV
ncbi:glyoxylate reductase [Exophiala xenobiotica]